MAMHDVEKTSVRSGYQNAKRMRRRKRLMPVYALTVLLLTACVPIGFISGKIYDFFFWSTGWVDIIMKAITG